MSNPPAPFVLDLHGLHLPFESLYQNVLVTGQPGSGKSRSIIRVLLRQVIEHFGNSANRPGLLVIDPKGDTTPWLAEALAKVGRGEDLQVLSPGTSTFNPLDNPWMSVAQLTEFIVAASTSLGRSLETRFRADEKFWELSTRALLHTILEVAVARSQETSLTFAEVLNAKSEITELRRPEAVAKWLQKSAPNLSGAGKASLREFGALPDTTASCVVTSVSNLLLPWSKHPVSQLVNPSPGLPSIDLFGIIQDGACICAPVAHPAYGAVMTPLLMALKETFAQIVLSRPWVTVQEDGQERPLNVDRPVLLCVDEFQRVFSCSNDTGEISFCDMNREFKCGVILSTQNLSSLFSLAGQATTERLCGLLGTQVFLANTDPATANHASQILGCKKVRQSQRSYAQLPPPPLLFPPERQLPNRRELSRQLVNTREPRVTPETLAQLRAGEFWVRTANGKVSNHRALKFER